MANGSSLSVEDTLQPHLHQRRPSFHQVLTRLDAAMSRRQPIVLGWWDDDEAAYREAKCQLLYFLDNGPIFSVLAHATDGERVRIAVDAIRAFPNAAPTWPAADLDNVVAYPC